MPEPELVDVTSDARDVGMGLQVTVTSEVHSLAMNYQPGRGEAAAETPQGKLRAFLRKVQDAAGRVRVRTGLADAPRVNSVNVTCMVMDGGRRRFIEVVAQVRKDGEGRRTMAIALLKQGEG